MSSKTGKIVDPIWWHIYGGIIETAARKRAHGPSEPIAGIGLCHARKLQHLGHHQDHDEATIGIHSDIARRRSLRNRSNDVELGGALLDSSDVSHLNTTSTTSMRTGSRVDRFGRPES